MNTLGGKRVLLGITGSIAAYKGAELVRRLRDNEAEVQVVMTRSATEFITPLTLQALSGRPVRQDLLDVEAEAGMGHIELARWADLVLVAPASADFVARLAQGRADDLLATVCLASEAPLLVAPAMNRVMWEDAATRANCELLARRGVNVLQPDSGPQACGEVGAGRMPEPATIVTHAAALFAGGSMAGLRVMITAGPTREYLDPVRYISNRSSGKMGYALARAGAEAGARVTLVSGPVSLAVPEGVQRIPVTSAAEMLQAVEFRLRDCDVFIGAAAVADYRPAQVSENKLKRDDADLVLTLVANPDIVRTAATTVPRPFTVGFAAESVDLERHALSKLKTKSLDMVVGNLVGQAADGAPVGFESDDNELTVFWDGGLHRLERASKTRLARSVIALIAARYHEKNRTENTG